MEAMQLPVAPSPDVCPVTQTLAMLGTRWTPLVIYHLHQGPKRYGELQRALRGISPKTLAERLQALEQQRLIDRTVFPDKPPRVEYSLTPRGRQLGDILDSINQWIAGSAGEQGSSLRPGP